MIKIKFKLHYITYYIVCYIVGYVNAYNKILFFTLMKDLKH